MAQQKGRPAPPPAPRGQAFTLIAMLFMILITVDPAARAALGEGMSLVLTPTIGFGGHLVVVSMMFAGLLTGVVSTGLRHWSTDYISMERSRVLQRTFQGQMNDARLKDDVDRVTRLRRAQPHLMSKTMELQAATMRPTVITMFLAISVFWWLSVFLDPVKGTVHVLSVSLPWAPSWPLHAVFGPLPYWVALYSIMSLPFTLALGAALKLWRYRELDLQAPLKPMPTLDELLERAEEGIQDDATVDREVERARRRVRAAGAGAATEETSEDEVQIVEGEDASIEEADEDDVRIVETKGKKLDVAKLADPAAEPDTPGEEE
jgi:uncharacterized membrane protein (DUF106 family)